MRWFIAFLLIANVVLFFWVQRQLQPQPPTTSLPPPEVGRLRLLSELAPDQNMQQERPVSLSPDQNMQPEQPVSRPPDAVGGKMVSNVVAEQRPDDAAAVPAPLPATPPATAEESLEAQPVETRPDLLASEQVAAASPPSEDSPPDNSVPVESDRAIDDATGQTASEVAVTPPPSKREPVCARVGPLAPKDADALVAKLPPHLELLSDVSEEYAQVAGYYVLIPALPSRTEGLRKLQELEDAGIKDIWLFRDGDLRNAISLGLYRNEDGARRHAEKVAKKGFTSEVRERTLLKERRWLQLKDTVGDGVAGSLPLPSSASITPHACP